MNPTRRSASIQRKMLIRILVVSLVPLVLLAGVGVYALRGLRSQASDSAAETREVLADESVGVNIRSDAEQVAREINLIVRERINDAISWANDPSIIAGAQNGSAVAQEQGLIGRDIESLESEFAQTKTLAAAPEAEAYLLDEVARATGFQEVFFTEANGLNVAFTNETSDFVQNDEGWWQSAWSDGIDIGDVEFDESAGSFSVDISVRIDDATGRGVGVMKAVLGVDFITAIVDDLATDSKAFRISNVDGLLIAESGNQDPDRIMNPDLNADEISGGLVVALRSPEAGSVIGDELAFGYARTTDPSAFDGLADFSGFTWIVIAEESTDVAFAPLRGLERLNDDIASSERSLIGTIIGLTLLGIAGAVLMAIALSRRVVGPIRALTVAARASADEGLPELVSRVNDDAVDPDTVEVPEVHVDTGDEVEELAASFNSVQATAVRLAGEQAASRRNVAEMFVSLGRRNQSLLVRQLRFIDSLEKSESDPDVLDSLFKLDHLATRMRRNAESLLVLAGEQTPRRWSTPVGLEDVVQAAMAEVENYTRVDMTRLDDASVLGSAVADVAHILAELIENGLNFSSPETRVTVTGRKTMSGYILTILDEGIGMSDDDLDAANERLISTPRLDKVPTQYLGLYVVGRLAARHDIEVKLLDAPTGGVAARVTLPAALTEVTDRPPERQETPASAADTAEAPVEVEVPKDPTADLAYLENVARSTSDAPAGDTGSTSDAASASNAAGTGAPRRESKKPADTSGATTGASFARRESKKPDAAGAAGTGAPRRESKKPTDAPGTGAPRRESTKPIAATESPTEDVLDGVEMEATAPATDATGFARRESKKSVKDEPVETPAESAEAAGEEPATPVTGIGFARRESKKSTDAAPAPTATASDEDTESSRPERLTDVVADAEDTKNRWSKFQKAKVRAATSGDADDASAS